MVKIKYTLFAVSSSRIISDYTFCGTIFSEDENLSRDRQPIDIINIYPY
jgi:hypothetical protein